MNDGMREGPEAVTAALRGFPDVTLSSMTMQGGMDAQGPPWAQVMALAEALDVLHDELQTDLAMSEMPSEDVIQLYRRALGVLSTCLMGRRLCALLEEGARSPYRVLTEEIAMLSAPVLG